MQKVIFRLVFIIFLSFFTNSLIAQQTFFWEKADWYFRNGKELLEKEYYLTAQQSFEQYILLSENKDLEKQGEAYYFRAYCALKLQNENATAYLEDFVRRFPEHPRSINAYYLWGKYYYQKYDYDKAIEILNKIPLSSLDYLRASEVRYMLGKSHFYNEDYEIADTYFETLKKGSSRYEVSANYYSGYIAYQNGNYEEALTDLRKASEYREKTYIFDEGDDEFEKKEVEKYQLSAPVVIAKIYYEREDYDEVIKYVPPLLLKNVEYNQKNDLNLFLAESYYFSNEYFEAANYYPRYISNVSNPDAISPEVYYNAGKTMFEVQNYEQATDYLSKAALDDGAVGQYAAYYLGNAYLNMNKPQFSVAALSQASRMEYDMPLKRDATFLLGQVYYNTEQYKEAIETLSLIETVRGDKPDNKPEEAKEMVAQSYLYSREYDQTIEYIEGLKAKNGTVSYKLQEVYQLVTYSQGLEYFNQEKYPEAIDYFEKSIFTYTPNKKILSQTAYWLAESYTLNSYLDKSSFQNTLRTKAIPLYKKVLEDYNSSSDYGRKTIYALGYAYYNLEVYPTAESYFNSYLRILNGKTDKEFFQDATLRLADCAYAQKNYNQAISFYNRAINQQFTDIDYAYYQKGMILFFQEQSTNAKENFDIIINNIPNSPYYDYALFQKGMVDLKASRFSVSIQHFSKLINEKPDSKVIPEALLNRGLAYQNISSDDKAIDDYTQIVRNYTQDPAAESALFGLQTLLQRAGRNAEFQELTNIYRNANPNSQALESIDFDNARKNYLNQKYELAISSFRNFIQKYPNSASNYDARYFIAESYRQSGDLENALAYYNQVIKERKSNYLGRAFQRAADIQREKGNYQNAINNYLILSDITDSRREQLLAWEGIMEAYYELGKYDSSFAYANGIIDKSQITSITHKAQLYKGKNQWKLGKNAQAITTLQEVSENSSTIIGAEAQYFWAKVLNAQANYDKSLEVLFDLNKKYASSIYDKWRGEAFLLIAENYIAMDETFQAKSTLESIIEKSENPKFKQRAENLLNTL